jgi:hypothetical protein
LSTPLPIRTTIRRARNFSRSSCNKKATINSGRSSHVRRASVVEPDRIRWEPKLLAQTDPALNTKLISDPQIRLRVWLLIQNYCENNYLPLCEPTFYYKLIISLCNSLIYMDRFCLKTSCLLRYFHTIIFYY